MSRYVLITADAEFDHRVRLATAGLEGQLQTFQASYLPANVDDVFGQLVGDPTDVLILGPDLKMADVLPFATAVDLHHPDVSIVYAVTATPESVLQCMRAGIRDLLALDATDEGIRHSVEAAASAAAARRSGGLLGTQPENVGSGRLLAVMSPKGGVGKTTIATNLAVGLAKVAPNNVVLVDLDLQFGDVASALQMTPERTIADAIAGATDALTLKTYLSRHSSGAFILAAPRNPADMDRISPDHVAQLLKTLVREFQFVVVDTAPGLGEHVLAALELTTDAVWVCGMDIPSVRGLHSGIAILEELGMLPEHRHVVLNMADRHSGITLKDVEATIGVPVDVVVPRSKAMPLATNRGIPALIDGFRDPAIRNLKRLVERFRPAWESREHKQLHRREVVQ